MSEIRVLRYRSIKWFTALKSPRIRRTLKPVATATFYTVFSVNPLSLSNCRTHRTSTQSLANKTSVITVTLNYNLPTDTIVKVYIPGTLKITPSLPLPTGTTATPDICVLRCRSIKVILTLKSPKIRRTLKPVATPTVLVVFPVNPLSLSNCRTRMTFITQLSPKLILPIIANSHNEK